MCLQFLSVLLYFQILDYLFFLQYTTKNNLIYRLTQVSNFRNAKVISKSKTSK